METRRIGWIGAGRMGTPMCAHLLDAGHAIKVYDLDQRRLQPLIEAGAQAAASVAELARDSDVVISMIFGDDALLDVVGGEQGLLAGAGHGLVYIDMSTVSPAASARAAAQLASAGIAYLRAPVSGTVAVARNASLSVYVSGPQDIYQACLPLLRRLTGSQTWVGDGDEARLVKLIINIMVHMSTAVIGEALSLGDKAGLDRAMLVDAINDSIVGSRHYAVRADWFKRPETSPPADLALTTKDMDLALDVARRHDAALPIATLVRQYLTMSRNHGLHDKGVMALAMILDRIDPKPEAGS